MVPASIKLQRTEVFLLVLYSVVGFSLLVPSASAIKCHQCNSAVDKNCGELSNTTSYLLDCVNDNSTEAFCRKTVLKVLKGGNTRIIRSCGLEKSREPCYKTDDQDHSETVCQCFEEGCNSAPGHVATLLVLTFLPALLAHL